MPRIAVLVRLMVARAALVVAATLSGASLGLACDGSDGVRCLVQADTLTSIVAMGSDFSAVGSALRDGITQPVLLRLSPAGEVVRSVALPWPLSRPAELKAVAEARKLIALPRGDVIVLGQAWYPGEPNASSWAMRVTEAGRVAWTRTFSDAGLSVILVTGAYDGANERLVLGGRLTEGSDDGQCAKWSQSLVHVVNPANGADLTRALLRGDRGRSGANREAISDIAPGAGPGGFMVAGFVTIPVNRPGRRCLDAMFVGALAPAGPGLALSTLGRIENPGASEVALSVRSAGPGGTYVVTGFRRDEVNEAPTALALLVRAAPFGILRSVTTPYPADRSDRTGSDQFRVAVPLPGARTVLLAGFALAGREPRRAMWQSASLDLQRVEPATIAGATGSDVLDAAVNSQGTVLLAGRWSDASGRPVAFVRPLGARAGSIASAGPGFSGVSAGPAGPGPRPPEARLPDIASLPLIEGIYRIPPASLGTGGGWAGTQLPPGGQVNLAFRLAERRTLKVSFATDRGEADLLVLDAAGRPVAFSNFGGLATEMLIATFPAGDYTIRLLPHVGAGSYQVRLAPAQEIPLRAIGLLQRLSEDRRSSLAQELASAGYASAPEPAMALGAETVRSLLAAQESAGTRRAVGPDGIGRTLTNLVEGGR